MHVPALIVLSISRRHFKFCFWADVFSMDLCNFILCWKSSRKPFHGVRL